MGSEVLPCDVPHALVEGLEEERVRRRRREEEGGKGLQQI